MVKHTLIAFAFLLSTNALSTQFASLEGSNERSQIQESQYKPEVHVISNSHVNRIVTPFVNPSLKMDSIGGVAYKQQENVIYLSTSKDNRNDIAAFITEKGDESYAIPVVLKPTLIGPQEVHVGTLTNASTGSALAQRFERSYPRDETIERVFHTLGQGELPDGYSLRNVAANYLPKCSQTGLTFDFYRGQLASGGDYVVTIGTVRNSSPRRIEFKENNCYAEGVVAVTSYPLTQLEPNELAEVFVMFYRDKPSVQPQRTRKSLIGG